MIDKEAQPLPRASTTGQQPIKALHAFTYRLSQVPDIFTTASIRKLFSDVDQRNIVGLISLADSVYSTGKVATVTFSEEPRFSVGMKSSIPDYTHPLVTSACAADDRIKFDNHFQGLTPLNDPGSTHITVDIVACSGLAASAFGGWQHANGKMWLRDFLPINLPGSRVFIWGKRSELHQSRSHMSVSHYRDSLLNDLEKIRKSPAERSRPLILVGHSLGGIFIKAAFVKASQDNSYSVLRDTIGGMVFFGTPHEGIENSDWVEIWGNEPPSTLIRDLATGSSLLRELREGFKQNLRQEKVLTVFELRETSTIQQIEPGKLDRKGKPVLRIHEKAACVHSDNEDCVPINEDHSKIARLLNDEGSPYHLIKDRFQDMVSQARSIVSMRVHRKSILELLLGLRAYFRHLHRTATQPSVLLVVEGSDIEAICHAINQYDYVLPNPKLQVDFNSSLSSTLNRLMELFKNSLIEASLNDGTLRNELAMVGGDLWKPLIHSANQALPNTPMQTEDIIRAAIPLILELKESLGFALLSQEPSLLRAFIEGDQAKQLGLDLIVQRRELLNQSEIPLAQPSNGNLKGISERNGLLVGIYYTADRLESYKVIVENRSYGRSGADQSMKTKKKKASQELATILRDASFRPGEESSKENSPREDNAIRRRLNPTMSIFRFEGYIDDTGSEQLIFMYRLPTQLGIPPEVILDRSRSFAHWIRDTGDGPPRLEERYAVAYHLCHTIFNQHVSGWVHKSIRPNNVIMIPTPTKESELIQSGKVYTHVPYLKGFESARKMTIVSDRLPEIVTEDDVYRHPDRRGRDIEIQFRPVHDLYAIGVLLVEIGNGKPILTSIKELKNPSASGSFERDTTRIAKEKIPKNLGTRYTECTLRCLAGYEGFELSGRAGNDAHLIFAFRKLVVEELKRMAVACGYSA